MLLHLGLLLNVRPVITLVPSTLVPIALTHEEQGRVRWLAWYPDFIGGAL